MSGSPPPVRAVAGASGLLLVLRRAVGVTIEFDPDLGPAGREGALAIRHGALRRLSRKHRMPAATEPDPRGGLPRERSAAAVGALYQEDRAHACQGRRALQQGPWAMGNDAVDDQRGWG